MEDIAKKIATHLSLGVEILGALINGIALLQFLYGYIPALFTSRQYLKKSLKCIEII